MLAVEFPSPCGRSEFAFPPLCETEVLANCGMPLRRRKLDESPLSPEHLAESKTCFRSDPSQRAGNDMWGYLERVGVH